jgi:hypothetical protein
MDGNGESSKPYMHLEWDEQAQAINIIGNVKTFEFMQAMLQIAVQLINEKRNAVILQNSMSRVQSPAIAPSDLLSRLNRI